jgi:hypothetical protein
VNDRWDLCLHSGWPRRFEASSLAGRGDQQAPDPLRRRVHFLFGAFRRSSILRPKGIGGGINRDDATLTLNPTLECLPDIGGILLGNRATRQGYRQSAEKKSHTSHVTYNKKTDP